MMNASKSRARHGMYVSNTKRREPAARLRLRLALVAVAVLGVASSGCTSSMAGDGRNDGGLTQAATTPLRDIGLLKPEVPPALKHLTWPYALTEPTGDCGAVASAITALDELLGSESYQADGDASLADRAGTEAGRYAVATVADAAADVLPYRSWVRRLSGASKTERKAAAAYALGEQRRTFLRGYALGLGCPLPLPAPPPDGDEHPSAAPTTGAPATTHD